MVVLLLVWLCAGTESFGGGFGVVQVVCCVLGDLGGVREVDVAELQAQHAVE